MLSLATRKISGFGFSFALAALLLNCATASAAGDGHDQAAALLSRSAVSVERSEIAPAYPSAMAVDPMDQARRLLGGPPASPLVDQDPRTHATSPVSATGAVAAYANAEESARRMILGDDA